MTNKNQNLYIECDLREESFVLREPQGDHYGETAGKIGIFSFFSGAGFLDLGFEKQGDFAIRFVNEFYLPFLQTYRFSRVNLGLPEPTYGYSVMDITWMLKGTKFKRIKELVTNELEGTSPVGFIGGPPCPDFSVAGKNKGREGENGSLSGTYVDLISRIKPDFFVFENVKGLYRTTKHREFFEEMKIKLKRNGYVLTERLVNALWYGAPQDRERILLVGFLKNSPRLGFKVEDCIQNFPWQLHERGDAADLKNLPWPEREPFHEEIETPPPSGIPLELTVQHWFEKNRVTDHPNSVHGFIPRAGLSKFKSIDEGDDKKKSCKRLHRWRYSPTAAYGNNEVHLHPYLARRLTVAETLAVQSLPADFLVPPSIPLTAMFKTVGNGVPYLLANGIAETISAFIRSKGELQ
jgi:DNA (cytosine-5)-methyltransferase 1